MSLDCLEECWLSVQILREWQGWLPVAQSKVSCMANVLKVTAMEDGRFGRITVRHEYSCTTIPSSNCGWVVGVNCELAGPPAYYAFIITISLCYPTPYSVNMVSSGPLWPTFYNFKSQSYQSSLISQMADQSAWIIANMTHIHIKQLHSARSTHQHLISPCKYWQYFLMKYSENGSHKIQHNY